MSCLLTTLDPVPQTVVLTHGPEWGYSSSLSMALEWKLMSSSRWRRWDAGAERDVYASNWTFRGTLAKISELVSLVDSLRGKSILMQSTDGIWPFGPLVDCSASQVPVRIGPYAPAGVLIGSDLWSLEIPIYLAQAQSRPSTQGSLLTFLARARFSPSVSAGWSIAQRESLAAPVHVGIDSRQTVASALLSDVDIVPAVRQLLWLRGAPFSISGAQQPFGPGAPPSNGAGSGYVCRAKAFSWSHQNAGFWDLSVTLVRDP